MLPLLGGLISGGLGLIGNIFSSNTSAENTQANIAMQNQTNQMSAEQAAINRNFQSDQAGINRTFQENMSSSAFQRASADMQRAGLNPAMMFGSAGAASTPGGAQASGSQASFGTARSELRSPFQDLGRVAESAVSTAINYKTYEKMTQEIANLRAEEAVKKAEEPFIEQKTLTEKEETLKRSVEGSLRQLELPGARVKAREMEKVPGWLIDQLAPWTYGSDKTSGVTDQLARIVSSAVGVRKLAPVRSQTQESGTDSSGKWYDRFREHKEWR